MACVHLQKLYQLCQEHEMRILVSGSDLVRLVCRECGAQDVCPSALRETKSSEGRETDVGSIAENPPRTLK